MISLSALTGELKASTRKCCDSVRLRGSIACHVSFITVSWSTGIPVAHMQTATLPL